MSLGIYISRLDQWLEVIVRRDVCYRQEKYSVYFYSSELILKLTNGLELRRQGSLQHRQSQHPHHTTTIVNRGASPVAPSEFIIWKYSTSSYTGNCPTSPERRGAARTLSKAVMPTDAARFCRTWHCYFIHWTGAGQSPDWYHQGIPLRFPERNHRPFFLLKVIYL